MADVERNPMDVERPVVAETVVDIPETIVDDDFRPIEVYGDITFDANTASIGEGRMASCASSETFTIHADEVFGSGSQGMVVRATDSSGADYAAKISLPPSTGRDRRNRKAVLESLIALMDEHPLGRNHYKQTHLMPLYAYGKIAGKAGSGSPEYDIAIMAFCDSSLGDGHGCSYDEIRRIVLPQTADGLRALHAQGIVHRDIKPKNLYMLDGSIVLGDYGISSLLDEGKDTGATVFDKRTPGYSPHSSVVQRENDWYALGYTIWTLYNNGEHPHQALIDAGDLSAVLAGKRPVEFIPSNPDESTLGDLIYGLTLEAPRGRLGYKDIQEWLDDPASFHFESPFDIAESTKTYQFRGHAYSNNAELANAMARQWDEATEHIQSETLEDFLKASGQHDLAVRVHKAMVDAGMLHDNDLGVAVAISALKGSNDEFAWKGQWHARGDIAEVSFNRLTSEPYVIYEYCADSEKVSALLKFLIAAYSGCDGYSHKEEVVKAAYSGIESSKGSDAVMLVDNLLSLFEILCSDKAIVRNFFLEYGMFGNSVWIKRNVDLYSGISAPAKQTIKEIRDFNLPSPQKRTIEQMRTDLRRLEIHVGSLCTLLPSNPYMRMLGTEKNDTLLVKSTIAYQAAFVYGEKCTLGYALSITAPGKQESICDFGQLRQAAAEDARKVSESIRVDAQTQKGEPANDHPPRLVLFMMICTLLAMLLVWNSFGDISQVCNDGFNKYAPIMKDAGGVVPDIAWTGYNVCALGLNVFLLGFTIAAASVLIGRFLQLVPGLFSSILERRYKRAVSKLNSDIDSLLAMSLAKSVKMLLENRAISKSSVNETSRLINNTQNPQLALRNKWITRIYLCAVILELAGMVVALVTWVPVALFNLDMAQAQQAGSSQMITGQVSMLFAIGIYVATVFRFGGTKPNMIAVMFFAALLPFFCWFSLDAMFGFLGFL